MCKVYLYQDIGLCNDKTEDIRAHSSSINIHHLLSIRKFLLISVVQFFSSSIPPEVMMGEIPNLGVRVAVGSSGKKPRLVLDHLFE